MKRTSSDRLIVKAQEAIKSDRVDEARVLLEAAARQDPDDPRIWFLLAGISQSTRERRAFIAQAERVKPAVPAGSGSEPRTTSTGYGQMNPNWARFTIRSGIVLLLVSVLVISGLFVRRDSSGNALKQDDVERLNYDSPVSGDESFLSPEPSEGSELQIGTSGRQEARPTLAASPINTTINGTGGEDSEDVSLSEGPRPLAKQVDENGRPLPTWTPTLQPTPTLAPTATPTITPEPSPTPEPPPPGSPRPPGVGADEDWIDVNLTSQTLTAFNGDTPVMSTLVSSGTWQYPTVTGQFRTWIKYESQTMNGYLLGYDYYIQDVPYVMYFFNDYAIHGAYWHNNFGTPMSHGCVNVSPDDAGWLFNWAPVGTLVNVHH